MRRSADEQSCRRFHVPHLPQGPGTELVLPDSEAHHAVHVLRLRVGEAVILFDGTGARAEGRIAGATRREVTVAVERVERRERWGGARVHLAVAIPKGNRLEWLLEKATELGAAALTPVVFDRSVAGGDELSEHKREKWLGRCIAAAKQSENDFLPDLRDPQPLGEFLARSASEGGIRLLGDVGADAVPLAAALASGAERQTILVGPEGGLSEAERGACITAGFIPVRLGRTVLRVETAAVALLAAVTAICEKPGAV